MYSLYRALFPTKDTEKPKYKRPEFTSETPNNTNTKPVFQIRWKKDSDDEDIATIFILAIVKHDNEAHNIYFRKYCDFCKEAVNNIVYPWAKTLNDFHDINDWEMDSLIIGNGYYKDNCDGDVSDCMTIYDTIPNGNTTLKFEAVISFLERDDKKIESFKEKCDKQLTNLYYEYFPNSN